MKGVCEMAEITYKEVNGVLYPELETERKCRLTFYGRERMRYLEENRKAQYSLLVGMGGLYSHCLEAETQALELEDRIIGQMRKESPPPRTGGFMEMLRYNNHLKDTAKEIVLKQIVYNPKAY